MSERVERVIAELTLDEQAALTTGVDMWHATGVERLGIRGLKVSDGPNGARGSYWVGTTSACLPCGTALGATWNPPLVRRLGVLLGEETRTKGADVLLGPTVNLHRSPLAGRNFECYSEDPYLTARLAVAYIEGVQSTGVATAVKHLAANDSEYHRHTISSDLSDRTLRELVLVPFEAAVTEARSMSIMAAYNRVNGVYSAEHPVLIGEILLGEWGFDGFVISDWWGVKSTEGTGRCGVDLEMPGPPVFLGAKLADAVRVGDVPAEALEAKVRRLLEVMERLGVLDSPVAPTDTSIDRDDHRALLREAAREAIVLLRNEPLVDGTPVLPIDPTMLGSIAVIGPNADVPLVQGGGSAAVTPHHEVTVLDGLRSRLGDSVRVTHEPGVDSFRNAPPLDPRWVRRPDTTGDDPADAGFVIDYFAGLGHQGPAVLTQHSRSARLTWLGDPAPGVVGGDFSMRLTGIFTAPADGPFDFTLIAGGKGRLRLDGEVVLDMWDHFVPGTAFFGLGSAEIRVRRELTAGQEILVEAEYAAIEGLAAAALLVGGQPVVADDGIARAAAAAAAADVAIVVVGLNQDWETEGKDRATMDLPGAQAELIEAVVAAQPATVVLVNAGSPVVMDWADRVPAVAQIWYLGQELGDAVAELLVGDHSPSGRLPTTLPRRYEDHPALFNYPGEAEHVLYGEGVFMGYRGYERRGVEPRYRFGHGLTYSSFRYGPATADHDEVAPGGTVAVSFELTNTGARRAAEVAQVYVADPESRLARPPQELKGFAKVDLAPGESTTVEVTLDERAFSYWDPEASGWVCEPGTFEIRVGASSGDIRSTVTVTRAE